MLLRYKTVKPRIPIKPVTKEKLELIRKYYLSKNNTYERPCWI